MTPPRTNEEIIDALAKQAEESKQYESGAVRSKLEDERYDLISPYALRRIALTYGEGAKKYSDHNWRKGFPVSSLLNHVLKHLNAYMAGRASPEDELAHAAWGLMAIMEQEVTHPELDDRFPFERRDLNRVPGTNLMSKDEVNRILGEEYPNCRGEAVFGDHHCHTESCK